MVVRDVSATLILDIICEISHFDIIFDRLLEISVHWKHDVSVIPIAITISPNEEYRETC